MADFLESMKIDAWYMVFVYLGGLFLIGSIFFPIQWITNKQLILVSSGMLFVGLGEWKNHKYYYWNKPPNAYTGSATLIQTKTRKVDLVGVIFDIIGIFLIILAFIDWIKIV